MTNMRIAYNDYLIAMLQTVGYKITISNDMLCDWHIITIKKVRYDKVIFGLLKEVVEDYYSFDLRLPSGFEELNNILHNKTREVKYLDAMSFEQYVKRMKIYE